MFKIDSEKALFEAFRPRDRKHLIAPAGKTFPLVSLDYLAWPDEHGERMFLLFQGAGETVPTGITFHKDHQSASYPAPRVCHWCMAYGSSDKIGMLSAFVTSKRHVGVFVCLDLGCGARVEDDANRRGKSARDAMHALVEKMARFSREALGIKQTNRNAPMPQQDASAAD
jgi:hypothetical protein